MKRIAAAADWLMDRVFNPKGHYDDGAPFRTFEELLSREHPWTKGNRP